MSPKSLIHNILVNINLSDKELLIIIVIDPLEHKDWIYDYFCIAILVANAFSIIQHNLHEVQRISTQKYPFMYVPN